jgi:hypothetical protein
MAAVTFAEPATRDLLGRMRESGADLLADRPDAARMAIARKRGFWRALEGFPALVACLFTRVRASAG